ncbi:bacteriohemerythrin [Vibrio hannami]|uniref:bacteriohemerythrin n=1 Tax=Vibrio hannami TaxID=2717094 RepID=UPI0024100497|nr:bacteriohemerythrin [Vibrio hannami]MDG3087195.1 bacteriohemerythrin [Vibrio hannami]
MERVLSPLILLLNRFSFRIKFMAIGVIFIAPLLVTNLILWSQLDAKITFAEKERVGIEYLPILRHIAANMAGHRGTTQGLMSGDDSFAPKVQKRKETVDSYFRELTLADEKLSSILDSQPRSQRIMSEWQSFRNNSSLSAADNFKVHTDLIAQVLQHMQHVANQSNLILDPELDSYYLMDTVVNLLPALAESMGQVRGAGAGAIAKNDLEKYPVLKLSVLSDRLVSHLDRLEVALKTAEEQNLTLKASLNKPGEEAVSATHRFIDMTKKELLSDKLATVAAGDYFDAGTQAIAACLALYDLVVPELDRLLSERIDEDQGYLNLVLWIFIGIILLISAIFMALYIALGHSIDHLSEVATKLAEGDLTVRSELQVKDELGKTSIALNRIANDFGRAMFNIKSSSDNLDAICGDMYKVNEKTCEGVIKQESDIDMAATSINQMTLSVQEVSNSTVQAADAADSAKQAARNGLEVVNSVVTSIEQLATEVERAGQVVLTLESDSNNITAILDVIRGIADQTNLLALNAAIEAARAGEHGRGFAVVADEVRTLAQRTQDATLEIQEMITKLQAGSQDAAEVMKSGVNNAQRSVEQASGAEQALQEIVEAVDVINSMSAQIATAAEQQGTVAEEINRSIISVKEVATQTSHDANLSRESSGQVRALSSEVRSLSNRFIVNEEQVEAGWVPPKKLFEWDDSYSVGVKEIDRQHRSLMTLANEYHRTQITRSARGAVARVMEGVIEYTKSHFQYEENLMEKFNYPELEPHKAKHRKLEAEAESFKERFERGEDVGKEFSAFMESWLLNHIKKTDQEYSEHLNCRGVY